MTSEAPPTTPEQFFAAVRTAVFVHAHPDDETLWSGNLMTELVARGKEVTLVTTNRGELGQVVDPEFAHLYGTDDLGPRREGEVAGALAELGVSDHVWLGHSPARAAGLADREYRDSGMSWVEEGVAGPDPEAAADPRCFTSAPITEPTADLAALLAARKPDAIITYDAHGGYGHPDHIRAHEIALAAGRDAGIGVWAIVGDRKGHEPGDGMLWFDLPWQSRRVLAALRHHRTQLTITPANKVQHESGFVHAVPSGVGLVRLT